MQSNDVKMQLLILTTKHIAEILFLISYTHRQFLFNRPSIPKLL